MIIVLKKENKRDTTSRGISEFWRFLLLDPKSQLGLWTNICFDIKYIIYGRLLVYRHVDAMCYISREGTLPELGDVGTTPALPKPAPV
jgi:hypothetical protein